MARKTFISFAKRLKGQPEADVKAFLHRVKLVLDVYGSETAENLADASPVGVFGAMERGWTHKGVSSRKGLTMRFENVHPYALVVLLGTKKPHTKNPAPYLEPWVRKKVDMLGMASRIGMSEKRIAALVDADKLAFALSYIIGRKMMKKARPANDFAEPIILDGLRAVEAVLEKP